MRSLGDCEADVMDWMWNHAGPATVREVLTGLGVARRWPTPPS